jgi:hypothetical protein
MHRVSIPLVCTMGSSMHGAMKFYKTITRAVCCWSIARVPRLSQDEGFFSNSHCARQYWTCRCSRFLRPTIQILHQASSSFSQSLLITYLYEFPEKCLEEDAYVSTAKAGLKLTTCSKPKSTITKTTTVQPLTTQTVTVTKTASFTVATYVLGKPWVRIVTNLHSNVQRTIQKTVTSTTVSQTTLVQTATSTAQTTLIVPVTVTDSQGETMCVPSL